jgi:hypothetical protein
MALVFDAAVESLRTGTTDPHTWTHAPVGVPRAIVVAIVHGPLSTDFASTVTYGGVSMTRIVRATDTATEPGAAELWFLGASIPTGNQTVSVDLTSATTEDIQFVSMSWTGGANTEVIDFGSISENAANPQDTMVYSGREAVSVSAIYSGVAAPSNLSLLTDMTAVHDHDFGAFVSRVDRQTAAGSTDFTIGYSSGADDVAFVALAFAEIQTTVSGSFTADAVLFKTLAASFTADAVLYPAAPSDAYGAAVYADDPDAWYRMGEASGDVIDYMGGSAGTAAGTLTRDAAGLSGDGADGAIDFSSGSVSVPDQASNDLAGAPFSIELIFSRQGGFGSYQNLISKSGGAPNVLFDPNNKLIVDDDGSVAVESNAAFSTADGPHHLIYVHDTGATPQSILYIDGQAASTNISNKTFANSNGNLFIGNYYDGSSFPFDGVIDEVAIYKRALTAQEASDHYDAAFGAGDTISGNFTADAVLLKAISSTATADAVLRATIPATYTADAILRRTESATFTADSTLRRIEAATFTANAVLFKITAATFTADAFLRVIVPGSFTADAVLFKSTSATYTADAILRRIEASSFTSDAVLRRIESFTFAANAYLLSLVELTFTADAILFKTTTGSATADAVLFKTSAFTATADAVLQRIEAASFTADAYLLALSGAQFTADAVIHRVESNTFTADAVVLRTEAGSLASDAILRRIEEGSFTADAIILAVQAGSFTVDAVFNVAGAFSFTADAVIAGPDETLGSFTADAIFLKVAEYQFDANAVLRRSESVLINADAVLRRTESATFTTDAILRATVPAVFAADGIIRREVQFSFTADAVLELAITGQSGSFTADAVLLASVTQSFIADAVLMSVSSGNLTADAIVRRSESGSFTADAWFSATTGGSFTADAILFRVYAASFTADAWIGSELSTIPPVVIGVVESTIEVVGSTDATMVITAHVVGATIVATGSVSKAV